MGHRVLATPRSFFREGREGLELLEAAGVEVVPSPVDRPLQEDELAGLLGEFDGLVAGIDRVGRRALAAGRPRLRVVARNGIGTDTVDVQAATEFGVVVTNAPSVNADSVADFTLALLLALVRRVVEADRAVRAGDWPPLVGVELRGKVLGLLGFGRIGQRVAERARGFGLRVLAYDPQPDHEAARELGVELVQFHRVLEEADFLSLHLPLLPETHHLLGEAELRRMKRTSYLVNTARGGVVDEAALARALREGWIAGAACDVFEEEPPRTSPLLGAPNLLLSPHMASHTREAIARASRVAAENVLAVLRGQRPPNPVNPEVLADRAPPREA
ncbi:MAG: phosphoglycerate dehydrogenase [Armatimonadota bacterium]|nr:phosphoglycerate dehydrogenase [Armatimonadota bacterium]MDR7387438.1 phosphoglycerate dehydrogenase [Armatimonadota bacterium]MDR7390413.1 phosphoglycerate dehydrogenase [Armatimonadota bacterium]MDR7397633.1 phosphoglycerate dehydrogenase [Armatimonadota bacterium]MDR7400281.1 phosphoglycerate dehydrogenase [Armatimonadota bacterium]